MKPPHFFEVIRLKTGQSLVELLIAVFTVIIAILGIFSLVNRSLGLNRLNADHYTATYLAAEGIELVKNRYDREFFLALDNNPGGGGFYGWGTGIEEGLYEMDYDDDELALLNCAFIPPPEPSKIEDAVFRDCGDLDFLRFKDGYFSYDFQSGDEASKFKRLIIIDNPLQSDQEYRVTSAVGWESRGGRFLVHLQDNFLPWRIP